MSTAQLNSVLSAREVDARLRAALEELQSAQRNAVLWLRGDPEPAPLS